MCTLLRGLSGLAVNYSTWSSQAFPVHPGQIPFLHVRSTNCNSRMVHVRVPFVSIISMMQVNCHFKTGVLRFKRFLWQDFCMSSDYVCRGTIHICWTAWPTSSPKTQSMFESHLTTGTHNSRDVMPLLLASMAATLGEAWHETIKLSRTGDRISYARR